jgi:hypothetical protein
LVQKPLKKRRFSPNLRNLLKTTKYAEKPQQFEILRLILAFLCHFEPYFSIIPLDPPEAG